MKPTRIVVGALLAVVLVGAVALAADELPELPGFLSAEEQVPVATPTEGQQVLVIETDLRSDRQTVAAEIRSQQVVANFAPKSVARSAGEWEVRVSGERELSYLIPNPLLDVEVENPRDDDNPYSAVPTEGLDWTLVVPLYDDEGPLGAASVVVVDVTTGEVVLETEVADQVGR